MIFYANAICVVILTILFYLSNNLHQLSGLHRLLEMMYMSLAKMGAARTISVRTTASTKPP